MRLQWLFVWLGVVAGAMLVCLHLYLHEQREVWLVRGEVGRMEQLRETGEAPVVSRLMGREMVVRRLNSMDKSRLSGYNSSPDVSLEVPLTARETDRERDRARQEAIEEEMEELEEEMEEDDEGEEEEEGEDDEGEEEEEDELEEEEEEGEVREGLDDIIEELDIQEQDDYVEDERNQIHLPKSKTSFINQTDPFSLRPSFSLPTPEATLPLSQLVQCQWMTDLKTYLRSISDGSRLVSIVSSDYKYREVLLNWLVTALVKVDRPLSNVLVLSLDASLHQLLREKKIACVHIPTTCLLQPSLKLTRHIAFTQVHIMRVLVMRLLNHWGYDVANYDSDALILRNPEPRYQELSDRHLIGSVGHFPREMDVRWGTAVCIGVVMIRASTQTELYWQSMSSVVPQTSNDQARLNWALYAMNMTWYNPHCDVKVVAMTGEGRAGFRVAVLPVRDVCRQTCSKKNLRHYYIWHKGGSQNRDGKMSFAQKGGLWYLRGNWDRLTSHSVQTGRDWLFEIATNYQHV